MLVQDIASKIMSFSQQGPRAVCILSANGAVSTVTLRQPATSGGTVTYEVHILLSFSPLFWVVRLEIDCYMDLLSRIIYLNFN